MMCMISTTDTSLAEKPARERILLTAHDLFYRDGIRATGIDKVIAEAGVSKVTFYRHFPSKNDLIRSFLEFRHQRWITWFSEALQRHGARSGKGLMAIVAVMEEWFNNPVYRGCAFINTAAELGDSLPGALDMCRSHKQDMVNIIAELLPQTELNLALANAAAVAIDGAIVRAQLESDENQAKTALASLALILSTLDRTGGFEFSPQPAHH